MIPGLFAALAEVGTITNLGIFFQNLSQQIGALGAKTAKTVVLTLDDVQINSVPLGVPTALTMGTVGTAAIILGFSYTMSNDGASVGSMTADSLNIPGVGASGFPLPICNPGDGTREIEPVGTAVAAPSDIITTIITRTVGTVAPGTNITLTLYLAPT